MDTEEIKIKAANDYVERLTSIDTTMEKVLTIVSFFEGWEAHERFASEEKENVGDIQRKGNDCLLINLGHGGCSISNGIDYKTKHAYIEILPLTKRYEVGTTLAKGQDIDHTAPSAVIDFANRESIDRLIRQLEACKTMLPE